MPSTQGMRISSKGGSKTAALRLCLLEMMISELMLPIFRRKSIEELHVDYAFFLKIL